jgi:hypothetical protein
MIFLELRAKEATARILVGCKVEHPIISREGRQPFMLEERETQHRAWDICHSLTDLG